MRRLFERRIGKLSLNLKLDQDGLEEYIKDINTPEVNVVRGIFEHLFRTRNSDDRRSIIHADKFDIYFDNVLNTEGVLFREFTPVLDKPWGEVKQKFNSWVAEGREGYLVDILGNVDAFESKKRFETVTCLWIMLANLGIRTEFIIGNWIQSISNNHASIERFYGTDKTFFFSLFRPNNACFFYDTYTVRLLLRNYIDKKEDFYFPLTQEDLQALSIERLDSFINSRHEFDIRVFNNFYYNCWSSKTSENHVIILDEANVRLKAYVAIYPKEFLRFVIRSKFTSHLDELFLFEPFIQQYFKGWDKFETFLRSVASDDPEFQEMVGYFDKFKKSGYKEFISEAIPKWIEVDESGNSSLKYFKDQTFPAFVKEMNLKYR